MDTPTLTALTLTAGTVGVIHTLLGPDHYIPFVAMSRAGGWSRSKTLTVTALCGLGHVAGSVLLGALGVGLGWSVGGLEWFEGWRAAIAGWLLVAFGLVYACWGLRRAARSMQHTHWHAHDDGTVHAHHHDHHGAHLHLHAHESAARRSLTPWILFTIFAFGPCEPLIPLLMYPAASRSGWGVLLVTAVFCAATVGTMTAVVALANLGFARASVFHRLERYSHAIAGGAVAACGVAVQLGL